MEITVRSGGQTGVDRAALDAAKVHNIEICGWCPKGGWAEDYLQPPGLLVDYPQLKETPSSDVNQRTEWNVRDSDVTIIIYSIDVSRGTVWTMECAEQYNKPYLLVYDENENEVFQWIECQGAIKNINFAGPRESELGGIYDRAYNFIYKLLLLLKD